MLGTIVLLALLLAMFSVFFIISSLPEEDDSSELLPSDEPLDDDPEEEEPLLSDLVATLVEAPAVFNFRLFTTSSSLGFLTSVALSELLRDVVADLLPSRI